MCEHLPHIFETYLISANVALGGIGARQCLAIPKDSGGIKWCFIKVSVRTPIIILGFRKAYVSH